MTASEPMGRHNTRLTRHNAPDVWLAGSGFVLQDVVTGRYFGGRHNTLEYKAVGRVSAPLTVTAA